MITITKKELVLFGFGPSQSEDIIRRSKQLMVSKGFGYYSSKRLGRVPVKAVEEILGIEIDASNKSLGTVNHAKGQ